MRTGDAAASCDVYEKKMLVGNKRFANSKMRTAFDIMKDTPDPFDPVKRERAQRYHCTASTGTCTARALDLLQGAAGIGQSREERRLDVAICIGTLSQCHEFLLR